MEFAITPPDETARLSALHELGLLDTACEERFDRITRLAAAVLDMPVSLISLVDSDRQWVKSAHGLEVKQTPRDVSFCGHTILADGLFLVPDALADERFADNPLVVGGPRIRFYAGCPLKSDEGQRLGTLCVIDREPRRLTAAQAALLADLASIAETEIMNEVLVQRVARRASELAESESRFRQLANSLPQLVWTCRPDGTCDFLSDQWVAFTGVPEEPQLGYGWLNQVHPDDQASTIAAWEAAQRSGMELVVEFRIRRHDGAYLFFYTRATRLRAADGQIVKWFGSNTDITERKQMEVALRQSEERLRLAMEAAQMGSWDWDMRTNTVLWSPRHEIMWGYKPGKPQRHFSEFLSRLHLEDRARVEAAGRDVIQAGKEYVCEFRVVLPDGSIRWISAMGNVQRDDSGKPVRMLGIVMDISERKRAEEKVRELNERLEERVVQRTAELRSANEELREAVIRRRQLEAEILHISEHEQQRIGLDLHDDLGQQLAGIWMLLQSHKNSLQAGTVPELGRVDTIFDLLKGAHSLTRSLARGLHPVVLISGGLPAALTDLAQRTSSVFDMTCTCICPSDINLDTSTATHLYRITQEALTNAAKHGRAREAVIELASADNETVLSVSDQGVGFPELEPDHKGMGLRIMRYRADMIGGTLVIQRNASGCGTMVTCSLPVRPKES